MSEVIMVNDFWGGGYGKYMLEYHIPQRGYKTPTRENYTSFNVD